MEQEIQFCKNPDVNRTMNEAYQISRTIPFNPNSYIYLDEIYKVFHARIESDPEFLKKVECLYAHNLFEYILKNNTMYDSKNIELNQILPNDILLITCPSIFADYHLFTAVINEDRTQVHIYQSYGTYKRLFKLTLPFETFIELMKELSTFKTRDFLEDYQMMIGIETKLYGINTDEYIQRISVDYEDNEDEDDDEDEDEDEARVIANSKILNITPNLYANLERLYNINSNEITITAYRLKPRGGKRTNKKRKTVKLRKRKFRKSSRRTKYSRKN
jgi:hypothetical protein